MKIQTLAVVLGLVLLALFAYLNWPAFLAPTPLNLGLLQVEAPLGLVMLGITTGLCLVFLLYIVVQQAVVIVEARRTAKELKGQREVADRAEASRFAEMRAFLEGELRRLEAQAQAANQEVSGRLQNLERGLQETLADSQRSTLAYLAEVEDKLDRALPAPRD